MRLPDVTERSGHARKRRSFADWTLIVLTVVCVAPLVWVVYTAVHLSITGGIEDYGSYKRVDLKAMGSFPFDEGQGTLNDVPARYRALDAQRVLLVGQMYVDDTAAPTVSRFQLVYSVQQCCFGGPPRVQERVFVRMPYGGVAPVYDSLAQVCGILHVLPSVINHRVVSVYNLDAESVVRVP